MENSMPTPREFMLAEGLILALHQTIGPGFHPDTPLDDYIKPNREPVFHPDDVEYIQKAYDEALDLFAEVDIDPAERCTETNLFKVFVKQQPELVPHPMFVHSMEPCRDNEAINDDEYPFAHYYTYDANGKKLD